MKHVFTLDLSPRENIHTHDRPVLDVGEIVLAASLVFVLLTLAVLVMGGF